MFKKCIYFFFYFCSTKKITQKYCIVENKQYLCIRIYRNGVVVQLVRIHACHAWGRGFESRPYRKSSLTFNKLGFFVSAFVSVLSFLVSFSVAVGG